MSDVTDKPVDQAAEEAQDNEQPPSKRPKADVASCIKLRGVSWHTKPIDVAAWLGDVVEVDATQIFVLHNRTGEAFALLKSEEEVTAALTKHRSPMEKVGHVTAGGKVRPPRGVDVMRSPVKAMEDARAARDERGEQDADVGGLLRLRGVPWASSNQDIIDFFAGFEGCPVVEGGDASITILTDPVTGRQSGEAFVDFGNQVAATKAQKLCDKGTIGGRWIDAHLAVRGELYWAREALVKSAAPPGAGASASGQPIAVLPASAIEADARWRDPLTELPGCDEGGPRVVLIKNLPVESTKSDIVERFGSVVAASASATLSPQLCLELATVFIAPNGAGRPSGTCLILLPDDATAAAVVAAAGAAAEGEGPGLEASVVPRSELYNRVGIGAVCLATCKDARDQSVCRIRGLPPKATVRDLELFFGADAGSAEQAAESEQPDRIFILCGGRTANEQRPTGEALVCFPSESAATAALARKNGAALGGQPIEVTMGCRMDVYVDTTRCVLKPESTISQPCFGRQAHTCVKMRGLPFTQCGEAAVRAFFAPEEIAGFFLVKDIQGRPSGEAFVEFRTGGMCARSLSKNRAELGGRYIELASASKHEVGESIKRHQQQTQQYAEKARAYAAGIAASARMAPPPMAFAAPVQAQVGPPPQTAPFQQYPFQQQQQQQQQQQLPPFQQQQLQQYPPHSQQHMQQHAPHFQPSQAPITSQQYLAGQPPATYQNPQAQQPQVHFSNGYAAASPYSTGPVQEQSMPQQQPAQQGYQAPPQATSWAEYEAQMAQYNQAMAASGFPQGQAQQQAQQHGYPAQQQQQQQALAQMTPSASYQGGPGPGGPQASQSYGGWGSHP